MANWRVDPKRKKKPKKIKGTQSGEWEIEKLVQRNPELLEHKYGIIWFDNLPNRAGDLLGLDRKGRFVIVEFKKRLGRAEEEKAARQVRKRLREISEEYTEDKIEQSYEKLCQHNYMKGLKQEKSFKREFKNVHNRELKRVKYDRLPSTYIVADFATRQAQESIRRKSKKREKQFTYMTIQFLRKEKTTSIYSVEKLI